jgi:hypothetical protein
MSAVDTDHKSSPALLTFNRRSVHRPVNSEIETFESYIPNLKKGVAFTIKLVLAFLPFVFVYLIYSLLCFRKLAEELDIELPPFSDLYYVMLCALIVAVARKIFGCFIKDKINLRVELIFKHEFWERKKSEILSASLNAFYHGLSSLLGLYLAWNSEIFPYCFFGIGKGKCSDLLKKWPLTQTSPLWHVYHLMQFGNHALNFWVRTFVQTNHWQYKEYFCHNLVFMMTMLLMYFTGFEQYITIILIVLDWGDFAIDLGYARINMMPARQVDLLYMFAIFSLTRCLLGPYCISWPTYRYVSEEGSMINRDPKLKKMLLEFAPIGYFFAFACLVIWLFNLYWTLEMVGYTASVITGVGSRDHELKYSGKMERYSTEKGSQVEEESKTKMQQFKEKEE